MPEIIERYIRRECTFMNQMYRPTWFVVHFTGGTPNLNALYDYWNSSCVSSHFGIGREGNEAGRIEQYVRYTDGSGANCCLEDGAAPFLPRDVNLNVYTITVECINPDSSNAGLMPDAQKDSLIWLIRNVCQQMNIRTDIYTEYSNQFGINFTFGDANGGVIMHRDICPINRQRCPGMQVYNDQMKDIMKAVNGVGGGQPMFVPPEKDRWIIEAWNAYYQPLINGGMKVTIPRRDTGIFNFWRSLLLNQNRYLGAVTSEEIKNGDYMIQTFTAGQIVFNTINHAITAYGPQGGVS
jgi:hypothetical protein